MLSKVNARLDELEQLAVIRHIDQVGFSTVMESLHDDDDHLELLILREMNDLQFKDMKYTLENLVDNIALKSRFSLGETYDRAKEITDEYSVEFDQ